MVRTAVSRMRPGVPHANYHVGTIPPFVLIANNPLKTAILTEKKPAGKGRPEG
jgi:hypothetical protein